MLRIGLAAPFRGLLTASPATAAELKIEALVYDPLVSIDPATLAPDEARSLAQSVRESNRGTTWTYRLRSFVRFSDGTPVRGADVARSLRRAVLPSRPISITAPDANTVVVRLRAPDSAFATLTVPIASVAMLGSGPYRIARAATGTLELGRNARTWLPISGPDRIVFRTSATREAQLRDLLAGSLDALEIGPRESTVLAPSPAITLVERPSLASLRLDFEDTSVPVTIRRALTNGIDRNAIVARVFDGHGLVARSVIPAGYVGWFRAPKAQAAFDRSAATSLLESEGWQLGTGRVRVLGDRRASFRLATDGSTAARLAARLVVADARALGIEIVPVARDDPAARARLALLAGATSPQSLLQPLARGNRAISRLLAGARHAGQTAAIANAYAGVQDRAAGENRTLPLAEPTTITAVSDRRWEEPAGAVGLLDVGSSRGVVGLVPAREPGPGWRTWLLIAAVSLAAFGAAFGPALRARGEPIERASA